MKLATQTKVVLSIGLGLGVVVAAAVGWIALDHDPQGEYSTDLPHLLTLVSLYLVAVFIPFVVFAFATEVVVRRIRRRRRFDP